MYFNIIDALYVDEYQIRLTFENGKSGIVNFRDYVNSGEVFTKFGDLEFFKNFEISYGTLCWGDGQVDIAPERLYELATGEPIVYPNIRALKTG